MFGTIAAEPKGGAFTRMTSFRTKSLTALVALACGLAQPATSHAGIAGTLALGHHDDGHTHAVSVEADSGHFDIVLSHAHAGDGTPIDAGHGPVHSRSCSEPDHVVHLGNEEPSCRSTRPLEPDAAPLTAIPFELPIAEPHARNLSRASAPQSSAASLLRTVVLRL